MAKQIERKSKFIKVENNTTKLNHIKARKRDVTKTPLNSHLQ